MQQSEKEKIFESRAVIALLALATSFLGWIGLTSYDTTLRLARLETRFEVTNALQNQIIDHETRIRRLERPSSN
jgi:hypothetical protein